MTRAPLAALAALLPAVIPAIATAPAAAVDPFADAVVDYLAGDGAVVGYDDPSVALGMPTRFTGEGVFPSVVSPFNAPFMPGEIVSIGRGGHLVVAFDEPVTDDPANPFGIDLLVFGNQFLVDLDWPNAIVGGLFGNGGTIAVSANGTDWVDVPDLAATGLFPTMGYLDRGPYDLEPGTVPTDFTRPVDPAWSIEALDGVDWPAVLAAYDGAGGGVGIDLGVLGLAQITHVRIANAPDAEGSIEIDALADVRAIVAGDANGDGAVDFLDALEILGAWGPCPVGGPCPADLDASGAVDIADLLIVLSNWS